jgi:hypothetical protein
MAGHSRSVDTGKARRTANGKTRKVREHLPPGEAETARRDKQHRGARTVAADRIARTRDPLRQLDIAREYLRSAAAKYQPNPGDLDIAVKALLAVGDRIFQTGQPQTAAARQTRRTKAASHRKRRADLTTLTRLGEQAAREARQNAGARRAS